MSELEADVQEKVKEESNKQKWLGLFWSTSDTNIVKLPLTSELEEVTYLPQDDEQNETDKPFSQDIKFQVQVDEKSLEIAMSEAQLPKDMEWLNQNISPEEKMQKLQQQFSQMNEDISRVVTAMASNTSILSKMANGWGELPLLGKITIGIVTGMALVGVGTFGVMAHIFILPTIAGVTGVFAITTTALLDNHYDANQTLLNEIKQGFISLASILQVTIFALEQIRQEFAVELDKLKQENETFKVNNANLTGQVTLLTKNVIELSKTREILDASILQLKQQCTELKKDSAEQRQVTKTLEFLTGKQKVLNAELAEQVVELQGTNKELRENKQKAQEMVATLSMTITQLTTSQIKDEQSREQFVNDLLLIVNNRDEKLVELVAGFGETEKKLEDTVKELEAMKLSYQTLNNTYAGLLQQHETIIAEHRALIRGQQPNELAQEQVIISLSSVA